MMISKEYNNFLVTDPREMEIQALPDKEFKIIILRHSPSYNGKQIKKHRIRNTKYMNRTSSTETEVIKKNEANNGAQEY